MAAPRVMVYNGVEDAKFDRSIKEIRKQASHGNGSFEFDPQDFKDVAASFAVEAYRLPREGLFEYARMATRLRQSFYLKADSA